MKNKIKHITIQREMTATASGMFWRNDMVFIARRGIEGLALYQTNDVLRRGNISQASVIRAKRAQVALMECAKAEASK